MLARNAPPAFPRASIFAPIARRIFTRPALTASVRFLTPIDSVPTVATTLSNRPLRLHYFLSPKPPRVAPRGTATLLTAFLGLPFLDLLPSRGYFAAFGLSFLL